VTTVNLLAGYLPESEAAALVGYSLIHFQRLRRRGVGPAYIKRGNHVIYKESDLSAWLDKHRIDPEAVA
jgi:hypothetical protein